MLNRELFEDPRCPDCGALLLNGRCENKACDYHWHPITPEEILPEDNPNDEA